MVDYNSAFVEEANEQLGELVTALLELEENPDDKDAMDSIFRTAHTLKGNAGAMEFHETEHLAHVLEDVLDTIRTGDTEITSDVVDVLFDGVDLLEEHVEEVQNTGEVQTDPEPVIEELNGLVDSVDEFNASDSDYEDKEWSELRSLAADRDLYQKDMDKDAVIEALREDDKSDSSDDRDIELSAPDDEDIDTLLNSVEEPDRNIGTIHHARVLVSPSAAKEIERGEMAPLESLHDAFTVLGTHPDQDSIESGEYDDVFAALIESNIGESNMVGAMDMVATVDEISVVNVTDRVDWAGTSSSSSSSSVEEPVDMADVEVDDALDSASDYDDIDSVDPSMVDDVEIPDDLGDSGTFSPPETDDSSDETAEAESEESEEPENRGTRVFDELQDEAEYTDDFDEIEREMEEVGFDELDDDEMDFDELVNIDPDDDEILEDDEESESDELGDISGELDIDDSQSEDGGLFGEEEGGEEAADDADDLFGDNESSIEEDTTDPEQDSQPKAPSVDFGGGEPAEETTAEASGDGAAEDVFGNTDTDDGADEDAEAIFDSGFSPDGEAEADDVVEESPVDSEDSVDDDFGAFDSAFDTEDGDDGELSDFDDLLRDAGRTPASQDSGGDNSVQSIRVDVDQLDDLYSQVQELITNRIRLRRAIEEGQHSPEALVQALDELDDLEMVSARMQNTVMDIRLVPLERAVDRLPRIARDVARDKDKNVNFSMEGTDVELDRAVLNEIGDPLMHIVRNAVDHGIESPEERQEAGKDEQGEVKLTARRARDRVVISVSDDGGGIDADTLREQAVENGLLSEGDAEQLSDEQAYELAFRPGFSTVEEITETSGRGVGMDVVYDTVRRLDGSVDVESVSGEGTTITLSVPVSLAIEEVMFLSVGDEEYGVPIKNVDEIGYVEDIENIEGQEAHMHDGDVYPLIRLDDTLDAESDDDSHESGRLIRISNDVRQIALHVDSVEGQEEVVVEPFDGVLSTVPGLSGASVLGEGNVVNILDVETL